MMKKHQRTVVRLPAAWLLSALVGCSGKDADSGRSASDDWLVPLQDLGEARTSGPDADLTDASDLWFVGGHFLPGIDWDAPVVDIPLHVFETIAMDQRVADRGSCPYEQLDGRMTTWRSDCRSTHGYEWVGKLIRTDWEDGGYEYTRWESNLTIDADIDSPEFDALSIQGDVVYVRGDDSALDYAVQGNITVGLTGYWEQARADDPREQAWTHWSWTGRDELYTDGRHHIEGVLHLNGFGTAAIRSDSLVVSDACGTSPTGEVVVEGAQTVALGFHGESDCRRCVDVEGDAGSMGEACAY